ncbi:MAG: type II toxin-antitoxin system VapC family toxin [Desulfosalsimonadaceae bacterium]
MNIIIDTHALLWLFSNDDKLSEKAGKLIKNPSNEVFVSIASFWEISIKLSLSKLVLDVPFALLFEESEKLDIKIIDIQKEHLITLKELPFIHRDPFDRMIVSQSIALNYALVSKDKILDEYKIKRIW